MNTSSDDRLILGNRSSTPPKDPRKARNGFTRVDLLSLIAILLPLLALLQTVRSRAAVGSPAAVCLENMRRLSLAWFLYASDHSGRLVPNLSIPEIEATVAGKQYLGWANNVMSWALDPMNTNTMLTSSSRLFPYLDNDPTVFQCPSDQYVSPAQARAGWKRRARSYSMNGFMGSPFQRPSASGSAAMGVSEWCPNRRQFLNLATIVQPSSTYVVLEEHPDSINDGLFLPGCGELSSWMDLPGALHEGACAVGFGDGHVELHSWLYSATKPPVGFRYPSSLQIPSNAQQDFLWLLERTFVDPTTLAVRRGATGGLQIAWSRLPTNYMLQATDQLSSGGWTNAELAPVGSFGQNTVHMSAEGVQRFFRLTQ